MDRFYDAIEVSRNNYILRYDPPSSHSNFSILSITFTKPISKFQAEQIAHREALDWIGRYPAPTAVYCSDQNDDSFHIFEDSFACYFWKDREGIVKLSNSIEESRDAFENFKIDHRIFSDFSFKTRDQAEKATEQTLQRKVVEAERLRG